MIDILDIIELIDEIETGCEYGALGVVCCKDGSYWYCNRDVEALSSDIEFRKANVSMQDALAESLLEPEELFMKQEDDRVLEIKNGFDTREYNETANLDYYGTKQQIIDEVMQNAFEEPFGFSFSL